MKKLLVNVLFCTCLNLFSALPSLSTVSSFAGNALMGQSPSSMLVGGDFSGGAASGLGPLSPNDIGTDGVAASPDMFSDDQAAAYASANGLSFGSGMGGYSDFGGPAQPTYSSAPQSPYPAPYPSPYDPQDPNAILYDENGQPIMTGGPGATSPLLPPGSTSTSPSPGIVINTSAGTPTPSTGSSGGSSSGGMSNGEIAGTTAGGAGALGTVGIAGAMMGRRRRTTANGALNQQPQYVVDEYGNTILEAAPAPLRVDNDYILPGDLITDPKTGLQKIKNPSLLDRAKWLKNPEEKAAYDARLRRSKVEITNIQRRSVGLAPLPLPPAHPTSIQHRLAAEQGQKQATTMQAQNVVDTKQLKFGTIITDKNGKVSIKRPSKIKQLVGLQKELTPQQEAEYQAQAAFSEAELENINRRAQGLAPKPLPRIQISNIQTPKPLKTTTFRTAPAPQKISVIPGHGLTTRVRTTSKKPASKQHMQQRQQRTVRA